MVTRQVKNERPIKVPAGQVFEQIGPSASGKTTRANAWMAKDPDNRRVVDGDRDEAQRLANLLRKPLQAGNVVIGESEFPYRVNFANRLRQRIDLSENWTLIFR